MPWTSRDVEKHKKGLTAKQKRAWVHVANGALKRCMEGGKSETECAGSAIQQANAISERIGESVTPQLLEATADHLLDLYLAEQDVEAATALVAEAATTKARVLGYLRQASSLLHDHSGRVPQHLAKQVDAMRATVRVKYADVVTDAEADEAEAEGAGDTALKWDTYAKVHYLLGEAAAAKGILSMSDSFDGIRQDVQRAISADPHGDMTVSKDAAQGDMYEMGCYPYIVDMYGGDVIYRCHGCLLRRSYTMDGEDVTLGATPTEVEMSYVPVGEAAAPPEEPVEDPIDEEPAPATPEEDDQALAEVQAEGEPDPAYQALDERQMDKNVGGGTDRDKIPAGDFAGKNRSFPIVTPQDVADAARSIGRAGSGNYSADQLKRRIIAIAKRKGASFTAKLPAAWKSGAAQESAAPTVCEVTSLIEAAALAEAALRADGTGLVKVIAPGWGSSGYYSQDVLRAAVGHVKPGLKMYWNHQTESERKARPERDLRDLAAVVEGNGEYKLAGPDGEGIYAPIRVFGAYREAVKELAPHIGVSICGSGKVKEGEAAGRKGRLVEELVGLESVDFVTQPGRDGKVLELFEAARERAYAAPADEPVAEGGKSVDEKEVQALRETVDAQDKRLKEAEDANLRLREDLVKRDVVYVLQRELGVATIHQMVRERLTRDLAARAPIEDYKLDEAAFVQLIREALKAEQAYLAEVTGTAPGRIRGLGESLREEADDADYDKDLTESFRALGLGDKAAEVAAAGR